MEFLPDWKGDHSVVVENESPLVLPIRNDDNGPESEPLLSVQ